MTLFKVGDEVTAKNGTFPAHFDLGDVVRYRDSAYEWYVVSVKSIDDKILTLMAQRRDWDGVRLSRAGPPDQFEYIRSGTLPIPTHPRFIDEKGKGMSKFSVGDVVMFGAPAHEYTIAHIINDEAWIVPHERGFASLLVETAQLSYGKTYAIGDVIARGTGPAVLVVGVLGREWLWVQAANAMPYTANNDGQWHKVPSTHA
jgi:hypothetical protein